MELNKSWSNNATVTITYVICTCDMWIWLQQIMDTVEPTEYSKISVDLYMARGLDTGSFVFPHPISVAKYQKVHLLCTSRSGSFWISTRAKYHWNYIWNKTRNWQKWKNHEGNPSLKVVNSVSYEIHKNIKLTMNIF